MPERSALVVLLIVLASGTARADDGAPPPILEDGAIAVDELPPLPEERGALTVQEWTVVRTAGPREYATDPPEEPECGYRQRVIVTRGDAPRRALLEVRCIAGVGRLEPGTPTLTVERAAARVEDDDPAVLDEPGLDPKLRPSRAFGYDEHDVPALDEESPPFALNGFETGAVQTGVGLGMASGVAACGVASLFACAAIGPSLLG